MDFAALMGAAMSKDAPPADSKKKYTRQADVEAQRVAAYEAEQARLNAAREEKARAKRQREEEFAEQDRAREEKRRKLAEEAKIRREEKEKEEELERRKRLGLPELVEKAEEEEKEESEDDDDDDTITTDDEAIAYLRALGHPVTLFGEEPAHRLRRARQLYRTLAVTQNGAIPTTLRLLPEKDMKVPEPSAVPPASDKKARKYLYRQLVSYFSMVLAEYQRAMEAEKDRRETVAGRAAYSAMDQCREYMKPLFRKFETGDIDDSLLKSIVEIVGAAQARRYVAANDSYLRLSIGKAAWPIGVTMVGIHERSAREKLHNGERGGIMGDEIKRKFLQSIKRCLTFAQVRWPPTDMGQLMG